jgi:MoaA/NifB/PqqE/SkfB family radical SAM enzyme
MLKIDQIKRIHVELTTRCNARCPMCPRNYRGTDYNSGYPLCELSLKDFQHIITPKFLATLSVPDLRSDGTPMDPQPWRGINFNGNLGDFSAAKDALEIVQYLCENNVAVKINTNGSARNTAWWKALALPNVEIGFAIDGLQDTHSLYRQDTDWQKIIENATAFISAGGKAVWRFVPFDHNRHQEDQCKRLSEKLGFVRFENIYDGRDTGPVYNRDGSYSHYIGHNITPDHIPAVEDLIRHHESGFDHRMIPIVKDTPTLDLYCTHKMNREIYLAADGTVYPCCYLGFYPASMAHPGNQQVRQIMVENNALVHDLEHCLEWFDSVEQSWQKPSVAQGRLYACVHHCNRSTN